MTMKKEDKTEKRRPRDWPRLEADHGELLFRILADNAGDILYLYRSSPNRGFEYVHPEAQRLNCGTAADGGGDADLPLSVVHPEDRANLEAAIRDPERFESGPVVWRWYGNDGLLRWVEHRVGRIDDPGGQGDVVYGIGRDVTEDKVTQEALSRSEHLAQALLDSPDQGALLIAKDGTILAMNRLMASLHGGRAEETLGGSVLDLPHNDLSRGVRRRAFDVFLSGKPARFETRLGGYHLEVSIYPVFGARDQVEQVVVFARGIEERRKAQAALERTREQYRLVVENVHESILIVQDGKPVFFNRAAVERSGYTEEEYSTMHVFERIHPDDGDMALDRYKRRLAGERGLGNFELRLLDKSGRVRWYRTNTVAIDWEGNPAVLVFGEDITEQKQAQEKIEASLREKEVLLREIHHRVKNNMAAVSSLLHLWSSRTKDERILKFSKESQERIRSMALVHEILYRSQSLAEISLEKYLTDLVNPLTNSYRPNLGRVEVEIEAGEIRIGIDQAVPCGLVINELVTNALKYAFPGRRPGRIDIVVRDNGHNRIELTVVDNGVGLPRGFDIHDTDTLGLSLAVSLVELQLGGDISFETGDGTRFMISFPLRQSDRLDTDQNTTATD